MKLLISNQYKSRPFFTVYEIRRLIFGSKSPMFRTLLKYSFNAFDRDDPCGISGKALRILKIGLEANNLWQPTMKIL